MTYKSDNLHMSGFKATIIVVSKGVPTKCREAGHYHTVVECNITVRTTAEQHCWLLNDKTHKRKGLGVYIQSRYVSQTVYTRQLSLLVQFGCHIN